MIDAMGKKRREGRNSAGRFSRKGAQIGSTITWIGAFLIIFFILLLFLSASVVVSKTKKVLSANYKISAETIEEEPLMQSRMLFSLLNSRIEIGDAEKMEITIKEALVYLSFDEIMGEGIKAQIKRTLQEIVRYEKPQCYLFRISSGRESIEFEDLASAAGLTFSYYLFSSKPEAYDKTDKIYIQNNKKEAIKVEIFAGRC